MTTIDLGLAQRRGTLALAGREVRRVLSLWTQTILPPVFTAVLFLAVFGGVLGDRIGRIEGVGVSQLGGHGHLGDRARPPRTSRARPWRAAP